MRGVLIASLACAVLAMDLSAATQAQAQMGGSPTGFGRGNRRPGGEERQREQEKSREQGGCHGVDRWLEEEAGADE